MKPNPLKSIAALITMACLSSPGFAADDHQGHDHGDQKGARHAHDSKARAGGVVTVVKDVNYELVAKPDGLALYVTDHGKPVDLSGASAKLMLLSATDRSETNLAPMGDRFEAKGSFKAGAGTKAVATVTLANQPAVTVKFTLR